MSENYIQQITLDYLINKENYKKMGGIIKYANKKDKKFYRKRILNLTKDLLLFQDIKEPLFPDVKKAFELYIKTCVEYFQTLDKTDIIQEEYNELEDINNTNMNMNEESNKEKNNSEENNKEEGKNDVNSSMNKADHLIMRSIKINPLDKYVKKTLLKKEEPIIPQQKNINFHEPYLKNKGICKKNNINNN